MKKMLRILLFLSIALLEHIMMFYRSLNYINLRFKLLIKEKGANNLLYTYKKNDVRVLQDIFQ